ncbi:hypothetical protein H2O64_04860 [Kordia sp. YSTF-M3]|uniref:Uncharacterized protein n=1 Tax=Kordia aestuariivivens TaxID=2759037 RepID=A0ABR7Q618_9FLAO|nr:hypothetical protein [Kordia aestuariivivens]MBC8753990.1 hypothetical protein [Kordia aestuariivivens]
MEESEKSKKENTQQQLDALEESIKFQDQKEIQELFKKMDVDDIPFDMYVEAINKQLSFKVSFEDVIDEEE